MSKVFVCISGKNLEECQTQASGKHSAELRLDLTNLTLDEVKTLWTECSEWILTLRQELTEKDGWEELFQACINLSPLYVDIDSELPEAVKAKVIPWVKNSTSDLILSFHNFNETPSFEDLHEKAKQLYRDGADVVKMACMAHTEEDNLTMMDLYREHKRLIAFCMGEEGRESRVTSLFFGEKISYAAPSEKEAVAPGQLTYAELAGLLNIGFDDE